jgi:hypothetical protein
MDDLLGDPRMGDGQYDGTDVFQRPGTAIRAEQ